MKRPPLPGIFFSFLLSLLLLPGMPGTAESTAFLVPADGGEPLAYEADIAFIKIGRDPIGGGEEVTVVLAVPASERMLEYTRRRIGGSLAVVIEGERVFERTIREPVAGRILLLGLGSDKIERFVSRFPNLLAARSGEDAVLAVPEAGLPAWRPDRENPGLHRLRTERGWDVRLCILGRSGSEHSPEKAFEGLKKELDGRARQFSAGEVTCLFYELPRPAEGTSAAKYRARGTLGPFAVAMDAELSGEQNRPDIREEAAALLEKIARNLRAAPGR